MDISVRGINFRSAPVAFRERIALSSSDITLILHIIRKEGIAEDALILSTCNRTEFYLSENSDDDFAHILRHITSIKDNGPLPELPDFYCHTGTDAVRHLFRTGASLDSQTVGETEILGQLKSAYRLALDAGTARFLFNKTLHRAFRTAKRVHSETALCKHPAGIPTAAAEAVKSKIKPVNEKSVLVIGAGKTAEAALRVLVDAGIKRAFCVSRTRGSAEEMIGKIRGPGTKRAETCCRYDRCRKHCKKNCEKNTHAATDPEPELRAAGLGQIPQVIAGVDAVISATGADSFVLEYSEVAEELCGRTRPLYLIDIAVPRDIDPAISELPCAELTVIDDLNVAVAESLEKRRAETPRAEAIVEEEVEKFRRWFDSLQVAPAIKKLKAFVEQQKDRELQRQVKGDMKPDRVKLLEEFADGLTAKLLHRPFEYLNRTGSEKSESEIMAALDIIHEMFGLDDAADSKKHNS